MWWTYNVCSLNTHFLSLQDEVLTVIRRVDENWAEGMLGDKIGIFPILYVEVNPQTLHRNTHKTLTYQVISAIAVKATAQHFQYSIFIYHNATF